METEESSIAAASGVMHEEIFIRLQLHKEWSLAVAGHVTQYGGRFFGLFSGQTPRRTSMELITKDRRKEREKKKKNSEKEKKERKENFLGIYTIF
jgi:hypothetical protein